MTGTLSGQGKRPSLGSPKKIFSLYGISFLFLAGLVVGFIWHDLRGKYRDTLDYWNVQLSTSADDQVRISTLWLNERRVDTTTVAVSTGTVRLLEATENHNSEAAEIRQGEERGIGHIAAVNGFLGGAVGDRDCQIVAQAGLRPEMAEGVRDACRQVMQAGQYRVDTFGMEQGHVWLSLSAPVILEVRASPPVSTTRRVVGSVIMVTENWQNIVPFFASASIPKGSSETYVVWNKGNETLIFSPRREAQGAPSLFRRPLSSDSFESRAALDGDVVFGEFTNYRGQAVFGVARRIGVPGYSLTREVNRDEALSAYHQHRVLECLVGTLSFLLLGSVIVALRRHAATRDLEQKIRQQEALTEKERRYRVLFESAGDGIFLMRGDQFVDCNQKALELFGCGREKLIGNTPWDFSPPRQPNGRDSLEAAKEKISLALKGQHLHFEWQHLRADRTPFDAEVTLSNLEIAGEAHILALVRDVTEQKQAQVAVLASEARLRGAQQRYKDFITHSNEGVWRAEVNPPFPIDLPEQEALQRLLQDTYFAECNVALAHILGYSRPEELVGKRFGDLISPSDSGRMESFRSAVRGRFQNRTVEFRGRDREGNLKNLLRTEIPIIEDGLLVRIWGITRDITKLRETEGALRESEARFRTLITDAPVAIGVGRNGVTRYVNSAYVQLFGLGSAEETFGRPILDQFAPQCHPDIRDMIKRRDQGLPVPSEYESLGRRKDGSTFPMHVAVARVDLEDGPVSLGFLTDLTERKRAEEELQRFLDQLRALAGRLQNIREEERKRVAREIHDQLGQALTAIKLDLSALLSQLPENAPPPSNRASAILKLVDETIQSVRRISTELRPGMLDDLGLVATVEWAGEDFETRTGTKCRLDLPPDDLAVNPEQATAIFRILQETLTNVARHAGASEVKVRLARENGDLTLEVHDNGKGIPEDKISSGASLGILGMRERAVLLGGEITIHGSSGKGTTVRVRIPEARHT